MCIYETPQTASHDFIQLDMDLNEPSVAQQTKLVADLATALGLVRLGVIYTDLLDDGTGQVGRYDAILSRLLIMYHGIVIGCGYM